jgi:hypothetical protein
MRVPQLPSCQAKYLLEKFVIRLADKRLDTHCGQPVQAPADLGACSPPLVPIAEQPSLSANPDIHAGLLIIN